MQKFGFILRDFVKRKFALVDKIAAVKKTVSLMVFLFILFLPVLTYAAPKVIVNSNTVYFDVQPITLNGRTLVPLRAIFQALDAEVKWDEATQTITATRSDTEIVLVIGGKVYRNGVQVTIEAPALIIKGRTMVPLRFVSESLGCKVQYDPVTQIITITDSSLAEMVKVHFIDVGQADAIYIDLPSETDILIDAGNKEDGPQVVNYLKNQGVDDIELLIATHPHEDHIGGIPAVLDAFKIEKIIDSGRQADTNTFILYQEKVKAENAIWNSNNKQSFSFGPNSLKILTAVGSWEEINDSSVVCRLDTGDIEFLFDGDAQESREKSLTGELSAEFLKVGNHGSDTSTTDQLLSKVKPEIAVISVGAGNPYGNPSREILDRLKDAGVKIYRADLNGTIVVSTDGKTFSIITIKC